MLSHEGGHLNWNHSQADVYAPQPQDPDASDITVMSHLILIVPYIMPCPFYFGRKQDHHCRSDQKPLFNLIRWYGSCTTEDNSIILRKNVLPNSTHAAAAQLVRETPASSSFSYPSMISLLSATLQIFCQVTGPSMILSPALGQEMILVARLLMCTTIGTPNLAHRSRALARALPHPSGPGGPKIRKSSSNVTLHYLSS